MQAYTLSNRAIPANATQVGTVQTTSGGVADYSLRRKSVPANYGSNPDGAPIVFAIAVGRRRQVFLQAA